MLSSIINRIRRAAVNANIIKNTNILINGKRIKFNNIGHSNLLKEIAINGPNSFEPELVRLIQNYPFKLKTFIDGGANVGLYSAIAYTSYSNETEIIAIEPFPNNVNYINGLKILNDLEFTLIDKALHSQSGKPFMLYYPIAKTSSKLSSSASLINSFQGTDGIYSHLPAKEISVNTITLEDVLFKKKYPALIKLDCEGNELPILQASKKILSGNETDFIIEIMIKDKDKHDIFNLMKSYSYDAYLITSAGLVKEDRPLTLPYYNNSNRTCWKNHYFTKRPIEKIKEFSTNVYNYWI